MHSSFKYFWLSSLLLSSGLSATQPYESIRLLSHQPYYLENGYILWDKVNSINTKLFIDIDSPHGEAARFIASNTGDVTLFAVHDWQQESQYHQFLSDVRQEGLDNRIIPLRMSSREASNALDLSAGVIFLDSSQSDWLYEKILMWVTQLAEDGVIAGNNWQSTAIEVAVVRAASELNLLLSTNGNYWFLQRP